MRKQAARGERRLDLEPIARIARNSEGTDPRHEGMSQPDLAVFLGVERSLVCKWFASGSLPMSWADHAACKFGYHPELLWPDFGAEPHTVREMKEEERLSGRTSGRT